MYAVVWIQKLSLQSVLRTEVFPKHACIAILRETAQRSVIYQVNSFAAKYGIKEGHTVSQAIAKCADLLVRPRKPLAEKSARQTLFSCLYHVTPLIEETTEETYSLQLSGIRKDEQKTTITALLKRLKDQGFHPQIGVASAPNWAGYAAKCAQPLLWIEDHRKFFQEVSIHTAIEDEKMRSILKNWGIHTLGAFAALPQQAIGKRLGRIGLDLWQSLQHPEQRLLQIKKPAKNYEASMELEYDVTTVEPLLFIVNRLIKQLCLQLDNHFLQAKVLILELAMDDKSQYRRIFKLPEPTTHEDKLRQLLETHFENLETTAPVRAITLKVIPTDATSQQNQLFQHTVRDAWKFASSLHQLIGLVGSENVGTPKLKENHLPDSFTMEPLTQVLEQGNDKTGSRSEQPTLRLQRFRPPIAAHVDLANGYPSLLQSNEIEGSIQSFRGPWHQSGTWWDQRHWKRLEWDIELENHSLYRIVYTDGRWFIDGAYG